MAVKSFDEERYDAIVTVHIGRRSELLKISGIEPHMFPERGKKRKCPGLEYKRLRACDPGWYSTTLQPGGRWRVSLHKQSIERPPMEDSVEIAKMRERMIEGRRESKDLPCTRKTDPPPKTSHLSEAAIHIAEGWTLLPPRMKAHVQMVIDDCLSEIIASPTVKEMYANANRHYQVKYERYIANRE